MIEVAYIGLGRTGLAQALVTCDSGYKVYGTDINRTLLEQLDKGILPFQEPHMEQLLAKHLHGNFVPTRVEQMKEVVPYCDYVVLSVNIGYDDNEKQISLDSIYSAIRGIFQSATRSGLVMILRTTLPIGTTDGLKSMIEGEYHIKEGKDFHLAFVPERLVEGYAVDEEKSLPKIIGTYSEEGRNRVEAFYQTTGGKAVVVSSPKVAELSKLVDNSFRSTMFSFANDLALVAEENGIDVLEVIAACNESYPRNSIPVPGPVSGTCLGKDPYILELSANMRESRGLASLWFHGRKANDSLVEHVVRRVLDALEIQESKPANILILGLSYREDVDDYRMSHSIDIIRKLLVGTTSAKISVYDPYINKNMYTELPEDVNQVIAEKYDSLIPTVFADKDVAIIANRHQELVAQSSRQAIRTMLKDRKTPLIIYDCWNLWREAAKLSGVIYLSLGYGR